MIDKIYIYVYSYLFHRILCIMLCKGACARSSVFTYRGCPLPNPLQGIGAICYFNIQFEHTRIQIKAISSENCQSRILPYNTSVTVRLLNRTKTIHKCTIQCTITTTTANRSFLFIYLQCHHLYHHQQFGRPFAHKKLFPTAMSTAITMKGVQLYRFHPLHHHDS